MLTLTQLIAHREGKRAELVAARNALSASLREAYGADTTDDAAIAAIRSDISAKDAEIERADADIAQLRADAAADAVIAERAAEIIPTDVRAPAYDQVARVGSEERTYRADTDPKGLNFALDVARAFRGDWSAQERVNRHMAEERTERGVDSFERVEGSQSRAVGTGAFTGIVVPSYLVDDFAGLPRADRPLCDAMNRHQLPDTGLTAYIGKLTTGTAAAEQTSENSAVQNTDSDDTLLTVAILTSAGSQTVSRQAIERGVGVEDTVVADLISAQRSNQDSLVINRASTGLTNVATAIAYTDGTPTAAELYPKLLAGPAAVEAAMLNAHPGDTIAVMHSRRWYWLQSQLTSTWPLFGQMGLAPQQGGVAYAERYGNGFRGILPSGVPVIVDNNIATNLGAGTNEDEIYFVSQRESHLWEDPSAPVLIRAEQSKATSLGVDLVVYAYFASIFTRVTHAQKVNGTGLITPAF